MKDSTKKYYSFFIQNKEGLYWQKYRFNPRIRFFKSVAALVASMYQHVAPAFKEEYKKSETPPIKTGNSTEDYRAEYQYNHRCYLIWRNLKMEQKLWMYKVSGYKFFKMEDGESVKTAVEI